jgi:HEPN domain-containing protein
MNPVINDWVKKAEGDFSDANWLLRKPESPNYDSVCFHSQQCIEKYIKAYLQYRNIDFEKTHSLESLLDLALPLQPLWEAWRPAFRTISSYAVEFRYPGDDAEKDEAEQALEIASAFRKDVRSVLTLETE